MRAPGEAGRTVEGGPAVTGPARLPAATGAVLWPFALLTLAAQGVRSATGPAPDLDILWSAAARLVDGGPLYGPGLEFIYPPLAGWALAPLGLLPFRAALVVMTVLSSVALVVAVVLALRTVGVPWRSPVTAGTVLLLALARPVGGLLDQGNVDVLLVLAEVVVVRLLLGRRDLAAAVLLGMVCALKPTLAPLLLGLVLLGRRTAAAVAAAVAAASSLVGLALVSDGLTFVTDVLPLLQAGNRPELAEYNRSLHAAAEQLGVPPLPELALRVTAVGLAVWLAWRRRRSPLAPAEVMSLLVLGALIASSFSWANYSLYLLPLLVTVARPESLVRTWPAWVAVWCLWTTLAWPDVELGDTAEALLALRPLAGWILLLGCCAWVVLTEQTPRRPPGAPLLRSPGSRPASLPVTARADDTVGGA